MLKKMVFVNTPCPELDDDRLEPPLGMLYMATMLRQAGIDCQICDLAGLDKSAWADSIAFGDIYGFSTYSVTYRRTLELAQIAKGINPNAITIGGGPHVSALPNECFCDFDTIITGEAETVLLRTVREICEGKRPRGILTGEPAENLDELPFPDYGLVDTESYNRIVEGVPSISIISSRGCPYNCVFCNSRVFSRGKLRFRSARNVVEEIKSLQQNCGIKSFRFSDDLFTFSPERVEEMTAAIKPLDIFYRIFARSSSLTSKAARQLFESGCRHVAIGVESMSAKMLQIIKKKTTPDDNKQAMENARKAGMKIRIYLLIGFPGETEETFQESLKLLLECDFDEFIVYPFIPYPGTSIWQNPELWGCEIDRDCNKYVQVGKGRNTCFAVKTKDFTPEDVMRWRRIMIEELEKKVLWAGRSADNK